MRAATQADLDAAMRQDLLTFARKGFEIIHPTTRFAPNWHIDAIAYRLEEMQAGRGRRQIVNMPPRMLKSLLISVIWPAFLLGRDPTCKIMVITYSEKLSTDLSNATRRLMQSDVYRRIFPGTELVRQAADTLETTKGGKRYAAGVGGTVTGFGGSWLILDDPLKASDAFSQAERDAVWEFVTGTLLTRLDNPSTGRVLVVMQRLHEDDPSGRLLSVGGWDLLKLQARATVAQSVETGPGQTHLVRVGDLLMPTRLPLHLLEETERTMGPAVFAAQFQQEPAPAEGDIIKRPWMRYGDPPPREECQVTLSLDTAVKTNPANDFSVCTVWFECRGKHYLVDVWREKVDFPDLKAAVRSLYERYRPNAILIEDAGSGSSLVQELHHAGIPASPCKMKDSKQTRLIAVSSYIKEGLVILPKGAPWLASFEAELLGFPSVRHDDQVDSVSQYLNWVRERPKPSEFSYDMMRDDPLSPESVLLNFGGGRFRR